MMQEACFGRQQCLGQASQQTRTQKAIQNQAQHEQHHSPPVMYLGHIWSSAAVVGSSHATELKWYNAHGNESGGYPFGCSILFAFEPLPHQHNGQKLFSIAVLNR